MNLLFVHDAAVIGGLETRLLTQAGALVARGHRVFSATRPGPMQEAFAEAGIEIIDVDFGPRAEIGEAIERVRRILRDERIDLVDLHPFRGMLPGGVAARAEGVPYTLNFHGQHDFDYPELLFRATVVGLASHASLITASSEQSRAWAQRTFELEPERVLCVPNAIDAARFGRTPPGSWPPRALVLLGRLDEDKLESVRAAARFVRAFAAMQPTGAADLPPLTLEVVGGGNGVERARELLHEALRDVTIEVTFPGATTRPDLAIGRADLVLGLGRVALEALAARRPMVVCGVLGNLAGLVRPDLADDWLKMNFNGRTAPDLPAEEAVRAVMQRDPADADRLAEWVGEISSAALEPWIERIEQAAAAPRQALPPSHVETIASTLVTYFTSLQAIERERTTQERLRMVERARDEEVAALRRALDQNERAAREAREYATELQQQLAEIRSSVGFQMVERYRAVKLAVAPEGTFRRGAIERVTKLLRSRKQRG